MGAAGAKPAQGAGIDMALLQTYFTQVGRTYTLQPGEVLIKQGSPSESVYLLVEGMTVLKKYNQQGKAKEIGTRAAGQVGPCDRRPVPCGASSV